MKKVNVLWLVLDAVFLIVFNVLFFVLGAADKTSVWVCYGFIHFAYVMLLITPLFSRKGKSAHIFGTSLYAISYVYFLVVLASGIVFIFLALDDANIPIAVETVVAGLYAILLIASLIANEHTKAGEERHEQEVGYMRSAGSMLSALMHQTSDATVKKQIERLMEDIKNSPTKSHDEVASLERAIHERIGELSSLSGQNADSNSMLASLKDIQDMVAERNRKLKTLN